MGVRVGFGLGDGLDGATVRVRVVGSTVDEFEFCANAMPAQQTKTEVMTRSLFIISSSRNLATEARDKEILNHNCVNRLDFW